MYSTQSTWGEEEEEKETADEVEKLQEPSVGVVVADDSDDELVKAEASISHGVISEVNTDGISPVSSRALQNSPGSSKGLRNSPGSPGSSRRFQNSPPPSKRPQNQQNNEEDMEISEGEEGNEAAGGLDSGKSPET
eukprot:Trichotokara_eunicae@DN5622_c0_g1_i3.p1